MVGLAVISWAIWKGRNSTCFEKKQIKSLGELLFCACAFLWYWVGLQTKDKQQLINSSVDLMVRTVMKLLGKNEALKLNVAIQDATQGEKDNNPGKDDQPKSL
jgi:hypothetical protein